MCACVCGLVTDSLLQCPPTWPSPRSIMVFFFRSAFCLFSRAHCWGLFIACSRLSNGGSGRRVPKIGPGETGAGARGNGEESPAQVSPGQCLVLARLESLLPPFESRYRLGCLPPALDFGTARLDGIYQLKNTRSRTSLLCLIPKPLR